MRRINPISMIMSFLGAATAQQKPVHQKYRAPLQPETIQEYSQKSTINRTTRHPFFHRMRRGNRHMPHQGKQECARRRQQLKRGIIQP